VKVASFDHGLTEKTQVSLSVSQVTKLYVIYHTFSLAISVLNKIPLSRI